MSNTKDRHFQKKLDTLFPVDSRFHFAKSFPWVNVFARTFRRKIGGLGSKYVLILMQKFDHKPVFNKRANFCQNLRKSPKIVKFTYIDTWQ
jgi:hypothetical protein